MRCMLFFWKLENRDWTSKSFKYNPESTYTIKPKTNQSLLFFGGHDTSLVVTAARLDLPSKGNLKPKQVITQQLSEAQPFQA